MFEWIVSLGLQYKIGNEWLKLLLGPILIDTHNGDTKKTATSRDIATIQQIQDVIGPHDTETLYRTLMKERFDVSRFSDDELLRMDYKQYLFSSFSSNPKNNINLAWGIASLKQGIMSYSYL